MDGERGDMNGWGTRRYEWMGGTRAGLAIGGRRKGKHVVRAGQQAGWGTARHVPDAWEADGERGRGKG
eukprot:364388-Chlamydomonas_euryale.AAC.21